MFATITRQWLDGNKQRLAGAEASTSPKAIRTALSQIEEEQPMGLYRCELCDEKHLPVLAAFGSTPEDAAKEAIAMHRKAARGGGR